MKRKASYTIEAAIVLPIFIFVCASILVFFQILKVEWGVAVSLNETAREVAVAGGASSDKENTNNGEKLKQAAVLLAKARIAAHNVPLSIVQLGIVGMNFSKSSVDEENVELVVSYKVVLPVSYFGRREMSFSQRALAHRWVGFDPKDGIGGEVDGDSVYVTATGSAYHKSLSCSYLNPSIRPVSLSSVSSLRNTSGHKYYKCPLCKGSAQTVYITKYGENYHTTTGCSGLKRTIRSTTEEKAKEQGYHACSKCSK